MKKAEIPFEKDLEGNVVIVGGRASSVYRKSLMTASHKNGGSVLVKARGRHMPKAMDLSMWAQDKFDFIVDKIATYEISDDDKNGVDRDKKVSEIKILMKKRVLIAVAAVPVMLLCRAFHPATSAVVDSFFASTILNIFW